jgi:hypothetical protein
MHHRHLDTPCVLMSAWLEDDVRRRALALGAVAVYDKSDLVDSFRLAA